MAPGFILDDLPNAQPLGIFGWIPTWIVGRKYHKAVPLPEIELKSKRQRNNEYDPNAIAIYTPEGEQVGHLPRNDASCLAPPARRAGRWGICRYLERRRPRKPHAASRRRFSRFGVWRVDWINRRQRRIHLAQHGMHGVVQPQCSRRQSHRQLP